MDHAKSRRMCIVLRRFANQGAAALEIRHASEQAEAGKNPWEEGCTVSALAEGDFIFYRIEFSKGLVVSPGNWKRFAYDHSRVAELLSFCVRDNLNEVAFDPWSDELKERVEGNLMTALRDLSTIFDIKSLRCEYILDGAVATTIEGEHKNGEYRVYCFSHDRLVQDRFLSER